MPSEPALDGLENLKAISAKIAAPERIGIIKRRLFQALGDKSADAALAATDA